MALPFVLGLALGLVIYPLVDIIPMRRGPSISLGFCLFLGPRYRSRPFRCWGGLWLSWASSATRLGAVTIASAAVDDATGWILLASVAAVVGGRFAPWTTVRMIGLVVLFAGVMIFVARPLLARWIRGALRAGGGELNVSDLALLLVAIFLCAAATSLIGIFAIFGAFFLGAVLSGEPGFREAAAGRLRDFVMVFFVPIFFTYTGLRTDIGSLESVSLWLVCGAVLLAAVVGKLGGCGVAAWLSGYPPREAACIGVMMNTRGLMELVVINVGYDLHVIPRSVYCMLVMMALITTVMTTPLLLRCCRGTELEQHVWESGFLGRKNASSESADSAHLASSNRGGNGNARE